MAVSDSTGDTVLSTEAVLYRNQAGAAEAVAEARGGGVAPPLRRESPARTRPQPAAPAGGWIHTDSDLGAGGPPRSTGWA